MNQLILSIIFILPTILLSLSLINNLYLKAENSALTSQLEVANHVNKIYVQVYGNHVNELKTGTYNKNGCEVL